MRWREFNILMNEARNSHESFLSKYTVCNNDVTFDIRRFNKDRYEIWTNNGFWGYRLYKPVGEKFTFLQKIIFHLILKKGRRKLLENIMKDY